MGHPIQGRQVGNIGLGLLGFGIFGTQWRPEKISDEEIFAAIKAALAAGCNYFNAAEFYGTPDNNTLTILSRYYVKYPEDVDKILLNVKGCFHDRSRPDSSPEGVKSSVENCVRMIGGKGRIDQFEPARKDPNVDIEVTVAALNEQVQIGNIGGIALSEVSAQTIRRAAKVARIEAVEIELSLWSTEPLENGVVQACAELDIPIIAYSPLGRGMLAGQFRSYADLPANDPRRMLPRFQPDAFEANLRLVKEVEKLAAKKGCTPGQISINWILAISRRPGMPRIIPIPGSTNIKRIRENAVEIELTEEDMAEIDGILKEFTPVGDRYHKSLMALLDE
ncbi:NADP-dependent oxidoreductase domain-containing protein [Apodospora peruviana]|uniref:NADP-dependent oxidoreductase domain-containing protein n=1 Tax=Apodospora peruviana TaxID=516989 RepID=A0AAE0MFE0_9PEZI|nr:NADP-dependent oxidoreductase domain-containing protein [Apodospora peruviana]